MDHPSVTSSMQTLADAPMQSRESATWMWKYYLTTHHNVPLPFAVPFLQSDFENLPPTTVIVGEFDPLKDSAKQYAEKLKQVQVSVKLSEVKGGIHVFYFFPTPIV